MKQRGGSVTAVSAACRGLTFIHSLSTAPSSNGSFKYLQPFHTRDMSDIPTELQREIFELAVRSNHKDAALKLKLSLVAHHVHFWVDTVFYETVTILRDASGTKFLKLIDSKAPGFFGPVVKALLMMDVGALSCARILSSCTGVQSFAWWVMEDPTPALSAVSQLALQRLVLEFRHFISFAAALPPPIWLATLTHLETGIVDDVKRSDADLEQLRLFPHLTHVSLYAPKRSDSYAQMVVDNCPNLHILVMILGNHAAASGTAASRVDSRVVVRIVPPDSTEGDIIDDWEAAHLGLPNPWTHAEDILNERKRLAPQERAIHEK
ncbi:hypothetical protein MSAN_02245800 [Mycena sanguinolenta]|uniref:Uncharacterized protein n=1 Tax=Mycena sanguinolenta TaxID=230812 RepID=A0A8H7CJ01_9AGAR|nr:hypothetical protein MSAN_02245800 [Mycena sanguinolenta]